MYLTDDPKEKKETDISRSAVIFAYTEFIELIYMNAVVSL